MLAPTVLGLALLSTVLAAPQQWRQPQSAWGLQQGFLGQDAGQQEWPWPDATQQQQGSAGAGQPQRPQTAQTTPAPADGVLTVLPVGCQCVSTEQYNPVCGSDGNTYMNRQKLNCFAMCGTNVRFERLGCAVVARMSPRDGLANFCFIFNARYTNDHSC